MAVLSSILHMGTAALSRRRSGMRRAGSFRISREAVRPSLLHSHRGKLGRAGAWLVLPCQCAGKGSGPAARAGTRLSECLPVRIFHAGALPALGGAVLDKADGGRDGLLRLVVRGAGEPNRQECDGGYIMKQILVLDENGKEPENMIAAYINSNEDIEVFLKGNLIGLSLINKKIQKDLNDLCDKMLKDLFYSLFSENESDEDNK